MGAYRSKPLTEKLSKDLESDGIVFGASEMQGWRVSMEDAWNCILDFDKSTSMFAVYDGHGGQEIAQYCSKKLPDFIKNTEAYKNGDLKQALEEAFSDIDKSIITEEVIKELKELVGEQDDDDDDLDEAAMLSKEANIPIEELLSKMKQDVNSVAFEKMLMNGGYHPDSDEEEDSECGSANPQSNGDAANKTESENASNEVKEEKEETKVKENDEKTESVVDNEDKNENEEVGKEEDNDGVGNGEDDDDQEEGEDDESDEDSDDSDEMDDDDDDVDMPQSDEVGKDSGATAIVALLNNNRLYVANVGDSRCVLCRGKTAKDMSKDHKPEDDIETARITKAGGKITHDGRVNGGLNLSRAIGDHNYKSNDSLLPHEQVISAVPDIEEIAITEEDKFMILACDGIWNVMTSQEAVDFILEKLEEQQKDGNICLSKICEQMFDHCIAPDTSGDGSGCDNMTCMIVMFKHGQIGKATSKKRTIESSNDEKSSENPEKKQKV